MNIKLERPGRKRSYTNRGSISIFLDRLRKTMKISVRISDVSAKIRNEHLPKQIWNFIFIPACLVDGDLFKNVFISIFPFKLSHI